MIQELYLIRALNIRKKYFKVTNQVSNYEKMIKDLSKMIDDTQNKLDETLVLIDAQKIDTVDKAKDKFLKILLDLETEATSTEKYMTKIDEEVEKLRKEELELFLEMKQNYPNLTDNDIKIEVQNYLKKFNLS